MVERRVANAEVEGSSPSTRSIQGSSDVAVTSIELKRSPSVKARASTAVAIFLFSDPPTPV